MQDIYYSEISRVDEMLYHLPDLVTADTGLPLDGKIANIVQANQIFEVNTLHNLQQL
jgi:hypothetical protein